MTTIKSRGDPIPLMEGAIDAVMALKKGVREANERVRVADEEAQMWKERYHKERRRVEQLEKELNLSSSRPSTPIQRSSSMPQQKAPGASNTTDETPATSCNSTLTPQEKLFAEESLVFYKPDDPSTVAPPTTDLSVLSMPDMYMTNGEETAEDEQSPLSATGSKEESQAKKKKVGSFVGTPLKKAYKTTKKALKHGDK